MPSILARLLKPEGMRADRRPIGARGSSRKVFISGLGRGGAFALAAAALLTVASTARADDGAALKVLKNMSDYLASQKTISLSFDADIEVITPDIEKIQFASSGELLLSRPDKLRAIRTGGYSDVEFVFDGKTASVVNKSTNGYVQFDAPGSVDQLVDKLRNDYAMALPGADLLASNVFAVLSDDVVRGDDIGRGVVGGVECEHLAFRNQDTDWQIWVQVGDAPIPRKFVITSKTQAAAPQYTLVVREWKTDAQPAADAFAFKPAEGAKKLEPQALGGLDEVPPGLPNGEKK
jgi:hypothetical protein